MDQLTMLLRADAEDRHDILRSILKNNNILLDVVERELGEYEVNYNHCKLYIRNVVNDDGELSSVPWLIYQINTWDGEVFEVEMQPVDPEDDLLEIFEDVIGELEIWW